MPSALQTYIALHPYFRFRPVHSISVYASVCARVRCVCFVVSDETGCHMARVKIRRYFQTSAPRI